jgi:hypothetical protein
MRNCILFIIIVFIGCAEKQRHDIFVNKISIYTPTPIPTDVNDSTIHFDRKFWDYLADYHQRGSVELFRLGNIAYPKYLVADTAFAFAMINGSNRSQLLQNFPKETIDKEGKKHEKDYIKFYTLLTDTHSDYIILIRKTDYEEILDKLATAGPPIAN